MSSVQPSTVLALRKGALAALACATPALATQGGGELGRLTRERTVKSEHRVPMRDGVRLFTAVYRPREPERPLPVLLCRTPYGIGPYGEAHHTPWFLGPSEDPVHVLDGTIFVYQDVRGRMMSEGEFEHMRPLVDAPDAVDERTDAYDTIEWLLANVPGNDGRVAVWGGSYDGFYAACAALSGHPALIAALVQGPQTDWYFEDFHRNGILCLADAFDFLSSWGWPHANPTTEPPRRRGPDVTDGYRFFLQGTPVELARRVFHGQVAFWDDLVAHPDRDSFWRARDLLPHVRDVRPAMLVVGGWNDHNNLRGTLAFHEAVARHDPAHPPRLVIGPWEHGGWQNREGERLGPLELGSPTARTYREEVEVPFLRAWLRGEGAAPPPEARVRAFDTGSLGWRSFGRWPPERASRTLHLGEAGSLDERRPETPEGQGTRDPLLVDPVEPAPAWSEPALEVPWTYVTEDQRFVEGRPDVRVYRSAPLPEPLCVAGPVEVELWISSEEAEDLSLVGVLVDEEPPVDGGEGTGFARLVRWGTMAARHREGFERPRPLPRGDVVRVRIPLLDVLHTFAAGHRLQLQVRTALFPILARQPTAWAPNPLSAPPEAYEPAVVELHRSAAHASALHFGVLEPAAADPAATEEGGG